MKMTKYAWREVKGYVYILDAANGLYKIGMSKQPKFRITGLSIVLPFDLHPLCLIGCNDYRQLERELHEVFADKRVRGEWFRLSSDDIDWIIEDAGAMGSSIVLSSKALDGRIESNLPYSMMKVGEYEV